LYVRAAYYIAGESLAIWKNSAAAGAETEVKGMIHPFDL